MSGKPNYEFEVQYVKPAEDEADSKAVVWIEREQMVPADEEVVQHSDSEETQEGPYEMVEYVLAEGEDLESLCTRLGHA